MLILIGPMGSGKSTIGRLLAARFRMQFIDLDEMIVDRAGKPIPRIFEEDGECIFRALEGETLERFTSEVNPMVIATGGGAVLSTPNRERIKRVGKTIWLDAPPEILAERITGDLNRPLLKGVNPLQKARELNMQRRPIYETCADFRVDTSILSVNEAVDEIAGYLSECADE
ncbi:MAG: shikimate kinase [Mariprofundaceae bacterium]